MFSGIIETKGKITALSEKDWGATIAVEVGFDTKTVKIGDSIAVSGVCLTVVYIADKNLTFDIVHETLRCSTLGFLKTGDYVNVERSLLVGSRIDGHIVSGHVDTTAALISKEDAGSIKLIFVLPKDYDRYIVSKGSITLSGVSLTVGEVTKDTFSVFIVPHTLLETTLGTLTEGEMVNVEIDILARYVMEGIKHYAAQ